MKKSCEDVGTFVWHSLTHSVRVCRDYLNYSEHGMPYVVDHFELTVTDVQLIAMNQLAMRSFCQA